MVEEVNVLLHQGDYVSSNSIELFLGNTRVCAMNANPNVQHQDMVKKRCKYIIYNCHSDLWQELEQNHSFYGFRDAGGVPDFDLPSVPCCNSDAFGRGTSCIQNAGILAHCKSYSNVGGTGRID